MTGGDYNRRLQAGESSDAIRNSQKGLFGNGLSDNQFNDIVTQAGMQSPTGRPLAGSAQFYQPVFQPQYQNYNMGNPMSISQYGQQPSYGGYGGGFGGGFGGYGGGFMPQMQNPYMYQQQQQQPQMNWQTGQMTQPAQPQMQTPFNYQPVQQAQPNYGQSQAIVGRSSQMRGTPNVMRRAEGGIASLLDNDE
jgi:hypothetical protein